MSVILLHKLSALKMGHLTRALEETKEHEDIILRLDCIGGKPSLNVKVLQYGVVGRLTNHDHAYQYWAFDRKAIQKGIEEHNKFRRRAIKEMMHA